MYLYHFPIIFEISGRRDEYVPEGEEVIGRHPCLSPCVISIYSSSRILGTVQKYRWTDSLGASLLSWLKRTPEVNYTASLRPSTA